MSDQFRVQDREHVNVNGRPCVQFRLFEKQAHDTGYIYRGTFYRPGRTATDRQCIAWAQTAEASQ
jgi:hypothetical protein